MTWLFQNARVYEINSTIFCFFYINCAMLLYPMENEIEFLLTAKLASIVPGSYLNVKYSTLI